MSGLLDGQTAIVSGGGRGFGRAIAKGLAAAGAHVVVASRNAPELDQVVLEIKRAGGRALAYAADVADERQVQELLINAERWIGPPSILVNNAGVLDPVTALAHSDATSWLRHLAINVGGTYLPTRAVLPGMLERGRGRIINISSGAASKASAGWTAYCAGKAAVEQMTRALALELEGTGVSVCALHPGLMETEMQERVRRSSVTDFPRVEEFREAHRTGEVQDPVIPARVVVHLAAAGPEYNGQIVDGRDPVIEQAAKDTLAQGGNVAKGS